MFSFGSAMAEAAASSAASTGANTSKRKEDVEMIKSRLSDQTFSSGRYPDPLLPRESGAMGWPDDVTPEMEQRWLAMIRAAP